MTLLIQHEPGSSDIFDFDVNILHRDCLPGHIGVQGGLSSFLHHELTPTNRGFR